MRMRKRRFFLESNHVTQLVRHNSILLQFFPEIQNSIVYAHAHTFLKSSLCQFVHYNAKLIAVFS
jgi:hypothetical protein